MRNRTVLPALGAAALLVGACSGNTGSSANSGNSANAATKSECVHVVDESGRTEAACLPLAPESARVDLGTPHFTHPTKITNRLHPTAGVAQTVYGGQESDKPFRTEVTLLPGTKSITWDGRTLHALTSQYVAFSDGRINEVAIDWYAQADDGSVWYLGEDVFNYEDGVVADTDGTWQAGKGKAPGAMIMPGQPRKGDVYRAENYPGVVFEEVRVKGVDQTVDGPYGKVAGALSVRELHMDGSTEDKVFAPGYGEFSTGSPGGDLEAVSLAVPTDAKSGPAPAGLTALDRAARSAHAHSTPATAAAVRAAWDAYRASDAVPALLERQMNRDLATLEKAPGDRAAALRVAQNTTDLWLRYEPVRTVDLERFGMWVRQLGIDAAAGDKGAVAGDVTSLELLWERLRDDTPKSAATPLAADLSAVRDAADRQDTKEAGQLVASLSEDIGGVK